MITAEQAAQYMDQTLGITVPGFFLDAAVLRVAAVESDMLTAGYTAEQQVLIQCMAVAIIASAGAPRRLQSQGAPSGASRSFMHDAKALSALRRSLMAADTAGVTSGIVGPDPAAASLFMAV